MACANHRLVALATDLLGQCAVVDQARTTSASRSRHPPRRAIPLLQRRDSGRRDHGRNPQARRKHLGRRDHIEAASGIRKEIGRGGAANKEA